MKLFQVYLFEFNEDNNPVRRPRHVLPHAVVEFSKPGDIEIPNLNLLNCPDTGRNQVSF